MYMHDVQYLYSDRCPNDQGLLQVFVIECRRVVVHVQDSDEDFGQTVLPLRVLRLDVEVVFGPELRVQAGPRLRGDEAGRRVDGKPAGFGAGSDGECVTTTAVHSVVSTSHRKPGVF